MTVKNFIPRTLITILTFSSLISMAQASEFGTIDAVTEAKWQKERVIQLVGDSADFRSDLNKGRSIAGQSQDDLKWANEFDTLMQSNDNVDYLEKALQL